MGRTATAAFILIAIATTALAIHAYLPSTDKTAQAVRTEAAQHRQTNCILLAMAVGSPNPSSIEEDIDARDRQTIAQAVKDCPAP